jgi:hypothetical protein
MSETTAQPVATHPVGEKLLAARDTIADSVLMLRVNTMTRAWQRLLRIQRPEILRINLQLL